MEAILSSQQIVKYLHFEYDILVLPQYAQMPEEYEPAVSQERQEGLDKQNIEKISPVHELFIWKQYVQFCFTAIDWYCYYVPTSYIRIQNCLVMYTMTARKDQAEVRLLLISKPLQMSHFTVSQIERVHVGRQQANHGCVEVE